MFTLYHHELYSSPDGKLRFRNDGSLAGSLPPKALGLVVRAALLHEERKPLEERIGNAMSRVLRRQGAELVYSNGGSAEGYLDALMRSGLSAKQAQGFLWV